MATTTVAAGRIRNKANENLPAPPGWLLTREGLPSTDPLEAVQKGGFLTSLGGSPERGSYKGYGLSMMVNVLTSCLSGSMLITDPMRTNTQQGFDIGHFFLALSPTLFREDGAFEADVASLCDTLRATTPLDPAQPVVVAGDPERKNAARRIKDGIPVGANLLAKIKTIATESGVPCCWGRRPPDEGLRFGAAKGRAWGLRAALLRREGESSKGKARALPWTHQRPGAFGNRGFSYGISRHQMNPNLKIRDVIGKQLDFKGLAFDGIEGRSPRLAYFLAYGARALVLTINRSTSTSGARPTAPAP